VTAVPATKLEAPVPTLEAGVSFALTDQQ